MSPIKILSEINARLLGDGVEMLTKEQGDSVLFVLRQVERSTSRLIDELEGQIDEAIEHATSD